MQIKTYTLHEGDDLQRVVASSADHVLLDFRPSSPNFITMIPTHAGIIPDRTGSEMAACSDGPIVRVGVVADEMAQNVVTRVVNYQLDVVLFTGNESPTLLRNLRRTLDPQALDPDTQQPGTIRRGLKFWKCVDREPASDSALYHDYAQCVDAFVVLSADMLTAFSTSSFEH